jgi:FkbM family methyltransferase
VPLLKTFREVFLRGIALHYLESRSEDYSKRFPQLAIFAFDFVGHNINAFGRYEKAELQELSEVIVRSQRRGAALDIGANIGNHSFFLASLFTTVHAFEPNESVVPLLKYNLRNKSNVVVHAFGASSDNTTLPAEVPPDNIGGGRVLSDATASDGFQTSFEVRRLDEEAELAALGSIDFIKMDIEGHELEAINGMASLIQSHGPMIAFEQHGDQVTDGTTLVVERLRSLGYSHFYEIASPSWRVPQSLPMFLRRPLRLIEACVRDPWIRAEIRRVRRVEPRSYPMMLASRTPLQINAPH